MPLEEPLGEEGPFAQLRDGHLEGPGPGVEVTAAVAVAGVDAIRRADAVLGAAHAVGLRAQQGVDEGAEELPHQVGTGLGELFVQEEGRVDTGVRGHRDAPFLSLIHI